MTVVMQVETGSSVIYTDYRYMQYGLPISIIGVAYFVYDKAMNFAQTGARFDKIFNSVKLTGAIFIVTYSMFLFIHMEAFERIKRSLTQNYMSQEILNDINLHYGETIYIYASHIHNFIELYFNSVAYKTIDYGELLNVALDKDINKIFILYRWNNTCGTLHGCGVDGFINIGGEIWPRTSYADHKNIVYAIFERP